MDIDEERNEEGKIKKGGAWDRARKNAGVEGKNVSKVKRKEAEVEEEVEVEVVATVVRGSRNRAGGGPALTDYGLASRRQPAWWGAPGVVVLFPSRLLHSFSFPRLPALPCYALPLALSSPTSFFTSSTLYTRVRVRVHLTDRYATRGKPNDYRKLQSNRIIDATPVTKWRQKREVHGATGKRTHGWTDEIRETILRNRRFSSATCRFDTAAITAKGLVERLAAAQ